MRVTLLDYTGSGHDDPAMYAAKKLVYAKNTRLTQGEWLQNKIKHMGWIEIEKELEAILMSVRSSWEFVSYTFQVEGVTRAFTHQFVRSRHASFAQQAMRVADMSEFDTLEPETVTAAGKSETWRLCMQMIASVYNELRESGIPAQDARGVLPTNVLTNIMAEFNLRALAELVGKRDNPRAQGEYVEVMHEMELKMREVHPWVEPFLHPPRLATPTINEILAEDLGNASPVDMPKINQALKELDLLRGVWSGGPPNV